MNRRRRKTELAATEGYQGSVSDLMAGLVILFIIALAVFVLQVLQLREDIATNVRVALQTRDEILNDIREELKERGVTVEVIHDQGVLRLTQEHIRFPQSRIEPDSDSHRTIGSLAVVMADVLPKYVHQVRDRQGDDEPTGEPGDFLIDSDDCSPPEPGTRDTNPGSEETPRARLQTVLIEGHTDIIPVDVNARITPEFRFRNNFELSGMRATRVYQMMIDCKPKLESLWNTEESIFGVSGYGATRLVSDDASLENIEDPRHAVNRRIDIRFLMELPDFDGLGGFLGSGAITDEVGAALESR